MSNNIKILFTSHHFETEEIFLNSIIKMTPNRSGIWKNIEATLDPNEADFYLCMDGERKTFPDMKEKAIYFCEHPYTPYSPKNKKFEGKEAVLKLPLTDFLNMGEWWSMYDYDYLSAMKPPQQDKDLICVVTYQTIHPMYAQRPKFVAELVKKYPEIPLDLYGRPSKKFLADPILKHVYKGVLGNENYDPTKGEHIIGKDIIQNYKYSLEFDVGECRNYFSERFYDSILLWSTPIYFGCTNLENYLPYKNKAYYVFDQNDLSQVDLVADIIKLPKYWSELAEVRNILLNKYQMWAYTHHVVNNIDDYKKDPLITQLKWINNI